MLSGIDCLVMTDTSRINPVTENLMDVGAAQRIAPALIVRFGIRHDPGAKPLLSGTTGDREDAPMVLTKRDALLDDGGQC